jgi:propionyl-CoA carboxylase alpha chain
MKHFHRILIANRGEIALRIMRTCRAMGIHTAAIYADPDRDAPFVRSADEAVYIGAPVSTTSFLAIDTIIDAARRVGADAIHPGYGFLAENAAFALACGEAGLTFIGPPPEVIRSMGSKIEAKAIMAAAGIPTIPGFSAVGLDDGEIRRRVQELGYPVLIKASAGGGGKGMRIVRDAASLAPALAAARREAQNAFGDDTLLVERYFDAPRHIEIQLLGDSHGNLLHCFERECSIQRRYQKIVEEAPAPGIDAALRQRMADAALAAGEAIHYENAGTVEFVVDQEGRFYFLEVNTRLQVEHPVTEAITGLDLVRLQILIAQGAPLPVRQEDLTIHGHAIECRVYAEDPQADFLPSTGTLVCWEEAEVPGIRYDSGVTTGSEVTIHYDPMLAKVVAHAATRAEAARMLAKALSEMRVHGVRTNLPLLSRILRHPQFLTGTVTTHFIRDHVGLQPTKTEAETSADVAHAVATALWLQEQRRASASVLRGLPSGWRNNPSQMQEIAFTCGGQTLTVRYRVRGHGRIDVQSGGDAHEAHIHGWDAAGIVLVTDRVRRSYGIRAHAGTFYVSSTLGHSELQVVARFPEPQTEVVHGGCLAPMPGRILAVRVSTGQSVRKGDPLVVLEAMKMEHEVLAPADGVVREIRGESGTQVDAGDVLVVLDDAEGTPS